MFHFTVNFIQCYFSFDPIFIHLITIIIHVIKCLLRPATFLLILDKSALILFVFGNSYRVEDAVIRYLNRKPVAGSDAPGST